MLMSLGMFAFEIGTLPYQELQRRTDWRHASTSRVGVRAARQFLGPGEDRISLSGWIAPEFAGDPVSLETLRELGDQGEALPLVDGRGNVFGAFVIVGVDERQGYFVENGAPRRIEFNIELEHVDDDLAAAAQPGG